MSLAFDRVKSQLSNKLRQKSQLNELRHFVALKKSAGRPVHATALADWGTRLPVVEEVVVWTSNDYLNLSRHPLVVEAAVRALHQYGLSSGGTRFLGGTSQLHDELETRLARLHNKPAALLFTSGYVANQSFLETLLSGIRSTGGGSVTVFSDQLNHASIIDGLRRARHSTNLDELVVVPHNDAVEFERRLKQWSSATCSGDRHSCKPQHTALVVVESVYSMSGAHAPLAQLCRSAEQSGAMVYVDEVHSVGVYGACGEGLSGDLLPAGCPRPDFIQGTLSKAFGSGGGYVAGPKEAIEYVRAFAPPFIFSTSLPPAVVAGSLAALDLLASDEGRRLRTAQRERTFELGQLLKAAGVPYDIADPHTHIITIPLASFVSAAGTSSAAIAQQLTRQLLQSGHFAQAICHPTVSRGSELLRIVATPAHTMDQMDHLAKSLKSLFNF